MTDRYEDGVPPFDPQITLDERLTPGGLFEDLDLTAAFASIAELTAELDQERRLRVAAEAEARRERLAYDNILKDWCRQRASLLALGADDRTAAGGVA